MKSCVKAQGLKKAFGTKTIINNLSFELETGKITALLGPNGAGKSTTIKMILGLREPDAGVIEVFGQRAGSAEVRHRIGYTSQDLNFPGHLKTREIVRWVRSHYETTFEDEKLIELFHLKDIWSRTLGGLSGGERRRVGLACAFSGVPELVVLDEPSTGLDLDSRNHLYQNLDWYRDQGHTLLICTHDLLDIERIADHVLLIDRGRVLFHGDIDDILKRTAYKKVTYCIGKELHEHVVNDADEFVRELIKNKPNFLNLEVRSATLEEAFTELRGHL